VISRANYLLVTVGPSFPSHRAVRLAGAKLGNSCSGSFVFMLGVVSVGSIFWEKESRLLVKPWRCFRNAFDLWPGACERRGNPLIVLAGGCRSGHRIVLAGETAFFFWLSRSHCLNRGRLGAGVVWVRQHFQCLNFSSADLFYVSAVPVWGHRLYTAPLLAGHKTWWPWLSRSPGRSGADSAANASADSRCWHSCCFACFARRPSADAFPRPSACPRLRATPRSIPIRPGRFT